MGKRGATTRTDAGYLGDACGDGCVVTEPTFWAFYLHAEWFKAPAARFNAAELRSKFNAAELRFRALKRG